MLCKMEPGNVTNDSQYTDPRQAHAYQIYTATYNNGGCTLLTIFSTEIKKTDLLYLNFIMMYSSWNEWIIF